MNGFGLEDLRLSGVARDLASAASAMPLPHLWMFGLRWVSLRVATIRAFTSLL